MRLPLRLLCSALSTGCKRCGSCRMTVCSPDMLPACRLGVGVIIFSTILFNIGTWLCHAYLNRARRKPSPALTLTPFQPGGQCLSRALQSRRRHVSGPLWTLVCFAWHAGTFMVQLGCCRTSHRLHCLCVLPRHTLGPVILDLNSDFGGVWLRGNSYTAHGLLGCLVAGASRGRAGHASGHDAPGCLTAVARVRAALGKPAVTMREDQGEEGEQAERAAAAAVSAKLRAADLHVAADGASGARAGGAPARAGVSIGALRALARGKEGMRSVLPSQSCHALLGPACLCARARSIRTACQLCQGADPPRTAAYLFKTDSAAASCDAACGAQRPPGAQARSSWRRATPRARRTMSMARRRRAAQ